MMSLKCNHYKTFSRRKFEFWWISSIGLWLLLNYIFYLDDNDALFTLINNRLALMILIIFTINCYWCAKTSIKMTKNYSIPIYSLSIILYTASLSSSSFIEEEHQTWYFFWPTVLLHQLFINIQKIRLFRLR